LYSRQSCTSANDIASAILRSLSLPTFLTSVLFHYSRLGLLRVRHVKASSSITAQIHLCQLSLLAPSQLPHHARRYFGHLRSRVAEEAGYKSLDTFARKSSYPRVKIAYITIAGPPTMFLTSDFHCTTRAATSTRPTSAATAASTQKVSTNARSGYKLSATSGMTCVSSQYDDCCFWQASKQQR
jgi:hypothetical protein